MAHIKSLHDDNISLCDMPLNGDFHFKSVDAAVLNGLHEKKPILCRRCCLTAVNLLSNGIEQCETEKQNY